MYERSIQPQVAALPRRCSPSRPGHGAALIKSPFGTPVADGIVPTIRVAGTAGDDGDDRRLAGRSRR
jgi:hypothetical protein